jgi:hypothetical protein
MKRDPIDFFVVRPEHREIHDRLCNWARWSQSGKRGGAVLSMFAGYRPDGYYELQGGGIPVDSLDAVSLQKGMVVLPEKNRWAVQWSYAHPYIRVEKVCRVLAVNRSTLGDLVHGARTMLKNRALDTNIRVCV